MNKRYKSYIEHAQKVADINAAIAVLSWDKEVNLPKKAAKFRSQQVATLSGMVHELSTDQSFIKTVNELSQADLAFDEARNIQQTKRGLEKSMKFDTAFVIEKSKVVSACFHAWLQAREKNDHKIFLEPLSQLVDIVKQESEILGYKEHPYDAMLDLYEQDLTVSQLEKVFNPLKVELANILNKIKTAPQVDDQFLKQHFDKDQQWAFGLYILKSMGYDFDHGRQDFSAHPFTISFNPEDVRVTTRIDENDFLNMTWSCIHEGGHALYEQGLPSESYGLPLGNSISLGIHESQSRLWENNVGRSKSFWMFHYPKLQEYFPEQLGSVGLNDFYKAINKIETNLIRTEADEIHYHLHVIIRYEIEKALMSGDLKVKDIRDAWNEKYKSYLGVNVPDDNMGFLQDIHWSHGSIGYFPTYSIGSLYAAQFFNQIQKDTSGLDGSIQQGDTSQILTWLRTNIHQHGQRYSALDLCKMLTEDSLNAEHFIRYVKAKYGEIYNIEL